MLKRCIFILYKNQYKYMRRNKYRLQSSVSSYNWEPHSVHEWDDSIYQGWPDGVGGMERSEHYARLRQERWENSRLEDTSWGWSWMALQVWGPGHCDRLKGPE